VKHNTVTPYGEASGEKKKQINTMFDTIAPYYDFLNRFLSLGVDVYWRKRAINMLSKDKYDRILDIATGTADMAIEMNKQLDVEEIVGLDLSANMVEIGNKKIKKRNLQDAIKLEVGDSENLRFDSDQFNVVTASFGVRNFADLNKGLTEMYRVLAPGGKLIILEFSKPTLFPFKQLFNFYFKYILPVIGKITSKDPKAYQYLYESVQAFPDYDGFTAILEKIGFKNTGWKKLTLGICSIYYANK